MNDHKIVKVLLLSAATGAAFLGKALMDGRLKLSLENGEIVYRYRPKRGKDLGGHIPLSMLADKYNSLVSSFKES